MPPATPSCSATTPARSSDAQLSGTILNGTLVASAGYSLESRVTLDAVTWQGSLIGHDIDVLGGLTLRGTAGSGPGAAQIFSQLRFDDSETVDNATVTLSNGTIDALSGRIVTFGAALVVEGGGGIGDEDETIDNAGTIVALAGDDLKIEPDAFSNTGTLAAQERQHARYRTFFPIRAGAARQHRQRRRHHPARRLLPRPDRRDPRRRRHAGRRVRGRDPERRGHRGHHRAGWRHRHLQRRRPDRRHCAGHARHERRQCGGHCAEWPNPARPRWRPARCCRADRQHGGPDFSSTPTRWTTPW